MARPMSRRSKRLALALAVVLTFTGIGTAFAYWTSTGTGTGSALTGESVAFAIVSESPVGTIAPGGAGQTIDFTVTNPGPGIQTLASVTVDMADTEGVKWVPAVGCNIGDYTVTITTVPTYGELQVGGTAEGTATVTMANTGDNQDACQGEDVPLYFRAS